MNDDNTTLGQRLSADTVRIERLLPGPIERLWTWLTDAEKRRLWLAGGDMQLAPGGAVTLAFHNDALSAPDDRAPPKYANHGGRHDVPGRVIDCEPPTRLVFSWGSGDSPSEVTFELAPQGTRVRLTVTHRRLASDGAVLSVASGWHAHLALLQAHLDGATPPSFWSLHTPLEQAYAAQFQTGT